MYYIHVLFVFVFYSVDFSQYKTDILVYYRNQSDNKVEENAYN